MRRRTTSSAVVNRSKRVVNAGAPSGETNASNASGGCARNRCTSDSGSSRLRYVATRLGSNCGYKPNICLCAETCVTLRPDRASRSVAHSGTISSANPVSSAISAGLRTSPHFPAQPLRHSSRRHRAPHRPEPVARLGSTTIDRAVVALVASAEKRISPYPLRLRGEGLLITMATFRMVSRCSGSRAR